MALGHSAAEAAKIVSTGSNVALDATWMKLHLGDPGAAGATSPALVTERQQISLGTPSVGVVLNDTAITWTGVSDSEDPTHYSLWTAVTAGTFLFSGTVTTAGYTAGNTFEIAIGDLDITQSTTAA